MKWSKAVILTICAVLTVLTGCGAPQTEAGQWQPESSVIEPEAPETVAPSAVTESALEQEPNDEPVEAMEPDPFAYVEKLFGGDVVTIDITASEEDWAGVLENPIAKEWISADVTVNGETFPNVGVKTKGNTSLMSVAASDSQRYSLKLNFGKFVDDQTCWGLDKLALNNNFADNTYMKEYMSYHLFQYMQVPASLCAFCNVTVNGEFYGFFLAVEDTDKSFLARNSSLDNKLEAYKPEMFGFGDMPNFNRPETKDDGADTENTGWPPMPDGALDSDFSPPNGFQPPEGFQPPSDFPGFPGGGFPGFPGDMFGGSGVSLKYVDDDPDSYSSIFDNGITNISDNDKKKLILALKGISEGEDLERYINVDEVLRYTACNVFLVNLDSYFSMMGHNYVLVEDRGQLSMVPWDYNLSFGTHEHLGESGVINYAIDTVFNNVDPEDRPIIGKLLEVEEYRERYHGYLRTIAEDYIGGGVFDAEIHRIVTQIDRYVRNDSTSFGGYEAFVAGIPALRLFGQLRAESVLGQLDGTIPSWKEEQTDPDALVDVSELDLSLLGSMNIGRPGFRAQP